MDQRQGTRSIISWAMYDWANSAFVTTISAGFFPIFFKNYWSSGADPTLSTAKLGIASSLASLLMACLAPFLGVISDNRANKKLFLFIFGAIGIFCSASLAFVAQGNWVWAALIFTLASLGFNGAIIFYESLLPYVASNQNVDRVSALGYSLGYLGGGLLFALNVFMYKSPESFAFPDGPSAIKASFLTVALWWAIFSIPLFLWVREGKALAPQSAPFKAAFERIRLTLRHRRQLKTIFVFLLAYWLYVDGVGTVIKMGVDYGLSIGLKAPDLITALLITQFVGFPAALVWGYIGTKWNARSALFACLTIYLGVVSVAVNMTSAAEFYVMAILIGAVQGGVQSLSRSFYAKLIPEKYSGEFFALFNLLGRLATVIGPLLIATVGYLVGSPRYGVASLALLFIGGGILLACVDPKRGAEELKNFA